MFNLALANLFSRPGRTVLAVLGLTIAMSGMVGLFSIAGGIEDLMSSTFGAIPGLVIMQPGAPIPLFSVLPAQWASEVADIDGVHVVTPEVWIRINMFDEEPILAPPLFLGGMEIASRLRLRKTVFASAIKEGRFLRLNDRGTNRCVISRQVASRFGKAIGDSIRINSRSMTVIGICDTGSLLLDAAVLADIDVVREVGRIDSRTVSAMYVEPEQGVSLDSLTERIQDRFRGRHLPDASLMGRMSFEALISLWPGLSILRLLSDMVQQILAPGSGGQAPGVAGELVEATQADDEAAPLDIQPASEMSRRFDDVTAVLNIVLGLLTGLGLLIAVFSILNTMLMSVTERTGEFGVLRANGWSRTDIVRLVTSESTLIGFMGGVLGLTLGWLATLIVNNIWADRLHLYASPKLLAFSLVFSTVVGVAGGCYPAFRAARMSPMDAIRRG